MVNIVTIIDGAAKIPMIPRLQENSTLTVTDVHSSGQPVVWPRHRMMLSNECDIENTMNYKRKMNGTSEDSSVTINARVNHEREASHSESRAQLSATSDMTAITEDRLDDMLQQIGVMPDETTLQSYPDRPTIEEDDDIDFVLVSQHENGTVCRNEGDTTLFERNGVKGDPFHFLKRLFDTWKKNHGFNKEARGLVRDAILIPNPEQVKALLPVLASKLESEKGKKWSGDRTKSMDEAQKRLVCPSSKMVSHIDRFIPSPEILEQRFTSVVKFIANIKDNKTTEPLFSKESWKVYHQFLKHIRKGCVSDEANTNYYYFMTKPSGRQVLHCCRGTSQLEGFHRHLRDILKATNSSPLLAVCLLAVFVHRWNHDRAIERCIISEKYKSYYEHEVIHDMQISADLAMKEQYFGDLLNPNDFVSTGETSYTPIVRRALQLVVPSVLGENSAIAFINDALGAMTRTSCEMQSNLEMTGERTSADIPVTKMTADDCTLFNELLAKYQEGPTEGRHFTTNYEKMCIEHNAIALNESFLPIGERRRIFAKTVPILKAHHKELKARENTRRTERQIVTFFDQTSCIAHATTVRRGVPKIREQVIHNLSNLSFKVPLSQPPEHQEPMASAVQDPLERTILFVPPPELQRAKSINAHYGPSHLQMPPPICNAATTITREALYKARDHQKVRAPQRCYRCGWARIGPNHKQRVGANTLDYCKTPQESRYPYWEVPYGYAVDDKPTTVRSDNMKKRWRQIMEEHGIDDDPRFPDWNPKRSRATPG